MLFNSCMLSRSTTTLNTLPSSSVKEPGRGGGGGGRVGGGGGSVAGCRIR